MTTLSQELAHKAAVALAEGAKQTAMAAALAAYNNTPAAWPAYDAAVKAADVAYMRAIIASAEANGHVVDGRQSLYWRSGSYT
jgi:hypothetical protein